MPVLNSPTNVNTYIGGTTFSAGDIILGNNAALGTGGVNMSNGTKLNLNNAILGKLI